MTLDELIDKVFHGVTEIIDDTPDPQIHHVAAFFIDQLPYLDEECQTGEDGVKEIRSWLSKLKYAVLTVEQGVEKLLVDERNG